MDIAITDTRKAMRYAIQDDWLSAIIHIMRGDIYYAKGWDAMAESQYLSALENTMNGDLTYQLALDRLQTVKKNKQ